MVVGEKREASYDTSTHTRHTTVHHARALNRARPNAMASTDRRAADGPQHTAVEARNAELVTAAMGLHGAITQTGYVYVSPAPPGEGAAAASKRAAAGPTTTATATTTSARLFVVLDGRQVRNDSVSSEDLVSEPLSTLEVTVGGGAAARRGSSRDEVDRMTGSNAFSWLYLCRSSWRATGGSCSTTTTTARSRPVARAAASCCRTTGAASSPR